MIGQTFLLHQNEKHPNRFEILVESYSDYTPTGHEAEIAEQIAVAALKTIHQLFGIDSHIITIFDPSHRME